MRPRHWSNTGSGGLYQNQPEQTAAREDPLTIRTGLCPLGAVSVKDT